MGGFGSLDGGKGERETRDLCVFGYKWICTASLNTIIPSVSRRLTVSDILEAEHVLEDTLVSRI